MSNQIVVVGAGIIGLASALLLAQDGFKVVIIARDLPGDGGLDWASPHAGAIIIPSLDLGNEEMARKSFAWYQKAAEADPTIGVKKIKAIDYWNDTDNDDHVWYRDVFPGYTRLSNAELPPGCTVGVSFQTCCLNPTVFLPWLKDRLERLGTKFIRAEIQSLSEAVHIAGGARAVINATGLGARELANDNAVVGYRGQTMLVKGDYPDILHFQGSEFTYVIPRPLSGGVIIGGISQEGDVSGKIDMTLREDILRRVNVLTNNSFAHINLERDVKMDVVGIRPGRKGGIRVEREGKTIHAYGFKGAGYVYSFGAAAKVNALVHEILSSESKLRANL